MQLPSKNWIEVQQSASGVSGHGELVRSLVYVLYDLVQDGSWWLHYATTEEGGVSPLEAVSIRGQWLLSTTLQNVSVIVQPEKTLALSNGLTHLEKEEVEVFAYPLHKIYARILIGAPSNKQMTATLYPHPGVGIGVPMNLLRSMGGLDLRVRSEPD